MALSRQQVINIIVEAAQKHGVDPRAMVAIAQIESNLNPNAKNPKSSAGGLFQFIDSTWKSYGGKNSRYDARIAADAAARLTKDNQKALERGLGRKPTTGELYLAHQQGIGGALGMLRNPDKPATDFVTSKAITLNGGKIGMTAGQFAQLWGGKTDKALKSVGAIPGIAGQSPTPAPALDRYKDRQRINDAARFPAGNPINGFKDTGRLHLSHMSLPNSVPNALNGAPIPAIRSLPPLPIARPERTPVPPMNIPPEMATPAPVGRVDVTDLAALPGRVTSADLPPLPPTQTELQRQAEIYGARATEVKQPTQQDLYAGIFPASAPIPADPIMRGGPAPNLPAVDFGNVQSKDLPSLPELANAAPLGTVDVADLADLPGVVTSANLPSIPETATPVDFGTVTSSDLAPLQVAPTPAPPIDRNMMQARETLAANLADKGPQLPTPDVYAGIFPEAQPANRTPQTIPTIVPASATQIQRSTPMAVPNGVMQPALPQMSAPTRAALAPAPTPMTRPTTPALPALSAPAPMPAPTRTAIPSAIPGQAPIPQPTIERPGMFDLGGFKLPGTLGVIQGIAHAAANAKGNRSSGFENLLVNTMNPGIQSSREALDYARATGDHSQLQRGDRQYDPTSPYADSAGWAPK